MLHAVIMAGGAGTRFWPASRADRPKQLLRLAGQNSMIQDTVERLDGLVSSDNILVVTNKRLVQSIRDQLPELTAESVIGEPCKRDTAPCIGVAAEWVCRNDPDAIMIVMPSDHVIRDKEAFCRAMSQAEQLILDDPKRIITFGIKPSYPAETFGYVERAEPLQVGSLSCDTYAVEQFREKPDRSTAESFLAQGKFYWNSGIFVWSAKTILNALREYEPQMGQHIRSIGEAIGTSQFSSVFEAEFEAINGKSIDFAVMEHYDPILVIEAPFDWDDVGNWPSLERLQGRDSEGNTIDGKHLGIKTSNTIVRSDDEHLVVTVGLDDCIVVHTDDATLVARKSDEESIRKVVEMLKENDWKEYL